MSSIKLNFKRDKLKSILKENGVKNYSHLSKPELEKLVEKLDKHTPKVEMKNKLVEDNKHTVKQNKNTKKRITQTRK